MHVVHRHDRYPEEDTQKYYLPLRAFGSIAQEQSPSLEYARYISMEHTYTHEL